jgi:hypothetical protein
LLSLSDSIKDDVLLEDEVIGFDDLSHGQVIFDVSATSTSAVRLGLNGTLQDVRCH